MIVLIPSSSYLCYLFWISHSNLQRLHKLSSHSCPLSSYQNLKVGPFILGILVPTSILQAVLSLVQHLANANHAAISPNTLVSVSNQVFPNQIPFSFHNIIFVLCAFCFLYFPIVHCNLFALHYASFVNLPPWLCHVQVVFILIRSLNSTQSVLIPDWQCLCYCIHRHFSVIQFYPRA